MRGSSRSKSPNVWQLYCKSIHFLHTFAYLHYKFNHFPRFTCIIEHFEPFHIQNHAFLEIAHTLCNIHMHQQVVWLITHTSFVRNAHTGQNIPTYQILSAHCSPFSHTHLRFTHTLLCYLCTQKFSNGFITHLVICSK